MVKKTMNIQKRFLFILLGLLLCFAVFIVVKNLNGTTYQKGPYTTNTATPLPTIINRQQPTITSVVPTNKSSGVPINQGITVYFNFQPSKTNVDFSIYPSSSYSISYGYNNLSVVFDNPLQEGTLYEYTVKIKDTGSSSLFYFTTSGTPKTIFRGNPPPGASSSYKNYMLANHPDGFLASYTPYSTNDFSITSSFSKSPIEHFSFVVTLIGSDKASSKNIFLSWVKSLGFADSQIQNLDITYQ